MKELFLIYSKENCEWCDKAKELIVNSGHSYNENVFGLDYDKEELAKLCGYPEKLKVPQIFYNGKHIGGYDDLLQYFEDHGININAETM